MRRGSVIAGAILCLLWAGQARAQLYSTDRGRDKDAANKLRPEPIRLREAPASGPVHPLRVRVYATRDYRAQTFGWQGQLRRLVERVNRHTELWPAVRFEVVEVKSWGRDSADATLEELLGELVRIDPATDVDLVVGLAVALPALSDQLDRLGLARLPGRHFVLRSLHDVAEYAAIRQAFAAVDESLRDEIVAARKSHKEEVGFIHEWLHTLGADHVTHPACVMNPRFDRAQSQLDEGNARLVLRVLSSRRAGRPDEEIFGAAATASMMSPRDVEDFNRAVDRYNARVFAEAWAAVEPLARRSPTDARVQALACRVTVQLSPGAMRLAAAEATCLAAARLAPSDVAPLLDLSDVHLGERFETKAAADAARAGDLLARAPAPPGDALRHLVDLHVRLRSPTAALAVARRAGPEVEQRTLAWAAPLRRRFAVPADAAALGLESIREREYIAVMEMALVALDQGKPDTAERLAAQLAREYPRLAGAALLRCETLGRQGKPGAFKPCIEALTMQDELPAAHFYAAAAAARQGKPRPAIAHLQRVIELEPAFRQAWLTLAELHRGKRDKAGLRTLSIAYERRFGQKLP